MEKKRIAELLIAWIHVCIEENYQEELKKAENMLCQILNYSQEKSLSITLNSAYNNQSDKYCSPACDAQVEFSTKKYSISSDFDTENNSFTLNNLNIKIKKTKSN